MSRAPAAQQGGPDGLCGIYALLNFLRNHPRFKNDGDQNVLRYLLEAADELRLLSPQRITHGFEAHQLRRILEHVSVSFDLKLQVVVSWPDEGRMFFREIVSHVERIAGDGGAVVLSVDRGEHWVLAHGVRGGLIECDDPSGGEEPVLLDASRGERSRRLDRAHMMTILPIKFDGYPESTGDL